MTDRMTWVEEGCFCKRYPTAAAADAALARSVAAAQAGVSTPAVLARRGDLVLCFKRIAAAGPPDLPAALRAWAPLSGMATEGLTRLDPFLRITPRLTQAPSALIPLATGLQAQDAALNWRGDRVVHGDFHPGQVLRDGAGKVWLVDLDDLALAPPEADLGNLAAWLATRSPGNLTDQADQALASVLALTPQADAALAGHFCRIALLRRALKLAERGQTWAVGQLALRA